MATSAALERLSLRSLGALPWTSLRPTIPRRALFPRVPRQTPIASAPNRIPARSFTQTPVGRRRYYRGWDNRDPADDLRNAKPLFANDAPRRILRSPSTKIVAIVAAGGAVIFYYSNIETVPVSGRKRFNAFSEEFVEEIGAREAQSMLQQLETQHAVLPDWDPRTRMVKRVMKRLIPVSGMESAKWEIHVIHDDNQANAFVMPGGKVFVFSGIIPIARNEDGLAAVLGHEIAHNLAQHTAERMSGSIGINMLLWSLMFIGAAVPGGFDLARILGGVTLDLLFSRPMGRKQESEADYIGLMMMAEACYNPEEALRFWQRMEKQSEMQPPEFLSTHPSHASRVENIREWLPKARDTRDQSDCSGTFAFADMFRKNLERGTMMDTYRFG